MIPILDKSLAVLQAHALGPISSMAEHAVASASSVVTDLMRNGYRRLLQGAVSVLEPFDPSSLESCDPRFFHPTYPEEDLRHAFRGAVFTPLAEGFQSRVYAFGAYVLKIPYASIWLRDEDRQDLYRRPFVGEALRTLNRLAGNSKAWKSAKMRVKALVNLARPQRLIQTSSDEALNSYELGTTRLNDLLVPCRVVKRSLFRVQEGGWHLDASEKAILQQRSGPTLKQRLSFLLSQDRETEAMDLLASAVRFHETLWRRGCADVDQGANVFDNLEAASTGSFRLIDAGMLSDDLKKARDFVRWSSDSARYFLEDLPPTLPWEETIDLMIRHEEKRYAGLGHRLRHLSQEFPPDLSERIGREFVCLVAEVLTEENLERNWNRRPA